ncbi:MEX3C ligase, partial [Neopipo cinnamomea]|nr:MEX3C ligase [Neopipo cinnamomea]
ACAFPPRTGCKIKALRAKTNTYIKTPIRGEEPVFVVTGRKEDVATAKREILSAAEHFSAIRASRGKGGAGAPALPGQTTVQVRVPYRVVGLVVGPKGATIKRIQQQTHTYIVTPSRDKEPVFEVTGMPENVDRAREEIETHIAVRTGGFVELSEEDDFHCNGTDVGFEGAWAGPPPPGRTGMGSGYRNDSSSSLGSGSTDSYFGSGRLADFSPTSPFSAGSFWFGEALPAAGAEDLAADPPACDPLPTPAQTIWTPFEPANPLSPPEGARRRHGCVLCFEGEAAAALVPCGHNLFCLGCAGRICEGEAPACPVCQAAVTQAIQIHS